MKLTADYVKLGLVYSSAWVALLLNSEFIYWDDWSLFDQLRETRYLFYQMVAAPQKDALHQVLLNTGNGIWIYRLLTFCAYLISVLSVLWLARQESEVSSASAFWFAALFAVYPVNQARIALINLPYSITLAAFLLAVVCMIRSERSSGKTYRITALLLFAIAFTTRSFLVFYAAPICFALFLGRRHWWSGVNTDSLRGALTWLIRHADYLLLPIIFFLLASRFLEPSDLYASYNVVSVSNLPYAVIASIRSILDLSWTPVSRYFEESKLISICVFVTVFSAFFYRSAEIFRSKKQLKAFDGVGGSVSGTVAGLSLLFLGFFPYHIVGKTPGNIDWITRHQLLISLGSCLLITVIVWGLCSKRLARVISLSLVTASIVIVNNDLLWYYMDGLKQRSLVQNIAEHQLVSGLKDRIILIEDETPELNAMNRTYRFYEYNGIFRRAFGDASRIGMSKPTLQNWDDNKLVDLRKYTHYNFSEYRGNKAIVGGVLTIQRGRNWPESISDQLKLFLQHKSGIGLSKNGVRNLLNIRFTNSIEQPG